MITLEDLQNIYMMFLIISKFKLQDIRVRLKILKKILKKQIWHVSHRKLTKINLYWEGLSRIDDPKRHSADVSDYCLILIVDAM